MSSLIPRRNLQNSSWQLNTVAHAATVQSSGFRHSSDKVCIDILSFQSYYLIRNIKFQVKELIWHEPRGPLMIEYLENYVSKK